MTAREAAYQVVLRVFEDDEGLCFVTADVAGDIRQRIAQIRFPLEHHAVVLGDYAARSRERTQFLEVLAAAAIGPRSPRVTRGRSTPTKVCRLAPPRSASIAAIATGRRRWHPRAETGPRTNP